MSKYVNQRVIARCRDQWSSLHRPPAHLVSLEQNSETSDYSFSQFYVSPMYDYAACRGQNGIEVMMPGTFYCLYYIELCHVLAWLCSDSV